MLRAAPGFDRVGPSTTGVAISRWLGLCRHRSPPGHPARRPGEARSANTDRASPEGKGTRNRRDPFRPGGVDARLKYSAAKALPPDLHSGNGAGKSTRTWSVSRPKKQPAPKGTAGDLVPEYFRIF